MTKEPESIFLKLQGNTARNRIMDFLIVHSDFEYSMIDIAKHSKIGYTTLKKLWPNLVKQRIVVHTKTIGRSKMFKLNMGNEVVTKFIDYYWAVVDQYDKK